MRISPCVLASCVLPWTERFELDEEIFRRVIRGQMAGGLRNLYLFGTAGEGYALTNRQFEQASRIFAQETEGKTLWRQLGVIALSIPQVQERIEIGRQLGIQSFQISFPSWGKLNDREVDLFFEGTCGQNPDCTFLFYNLGRGLRLLTGPELGALAARHPNLTSVKWAGRWDLDAMRLAVESAPELCAFFTDRGYLQASLAGLSCGLLLSVASTNRPRALEMFELGRSGSEPARLNAFLADMERHLDILRALPLQGSHMDGTYDKMLCKANLLEFPLRLLPPYVGSSEEAFRIYLERLRAELPQWLESPGG